VDAARALPWNGPEDPGDWRPVTRAFRDGHTETWYAADAALGWWGPDGTTRLVVATAHPGTVPGKATWYPATNLPRPGSPREATSAHPPADLAEVTRIYGIRHWIEQSYKQIKDQLGRADFQVRSDPAIRRHQSLVNCAFCFCWDAWFAENPPQQDAPSLRDRSPAAERGGATATRPPLPPSWPRAIRAVRAWLTPWITLQRWWQARSKPPPPPQLQALMNSVAAGRGLHLYIPN
jgi:hypothetical protein